MAGRAPWGEDAIPTGWQALPKPAPLRHCVTCGGRLHRYHPLDDRWCEICETRRRARATDYGDGGT